MTETDGNINAYMSFTSILNALKKKQKIKLKLERCTLCSTLKFQRHYLCHITGNDTAGQPMTQEIQQRYQR